MLVRFSSLTHRDFAGIFRVCASAPCENGGTCQGGTHAATKLAFFRCRCATGFSGDTCNINICDPSPCNEGACIVDTANLDGFHCSCNEGWTGGLCDSNVCDSTPCAHGGTCVGQADDSYTCTCPELFTGPNCESLVDFCSSTPCENGAQCRGKRGSFDCVCAAGKQTAGSLSPCHASHFTFSALTRRLTSRV